MPTIKSRKVDKRLRKKNNKLNTKKNHKRIRHSKNHNFKGGNFGGNCTDPNFSIYNTNLLKLFPYSTFAKG